jgi:primosomal protein N'
MNEQFNSSVDQCVLSHELVELMDWIVKHHAQDIKRIVTQALGQGLAQRLKKSKNMRDLDQAQGSILDFFELMESTLANVSEDLEMNRVVDRVMMPQLNHIDIKACDPETVHATAAVVRAKLKRSTKKNAQELLYEELLKQWKPRTSDGLAE